MLRQFRGERPYVRSSKQTKQEEEKKKKKEKERKKKKKGGGGGSTHLCRRVYLKRRVRMPRGSGWGEGKDILL